MRLLGMVLMPLALMASQCEKLEQDYVHHADLATIGNVNCNQLGLTLSVLTEYSEVCDVSVQDKEIRSLLSDLYIKECK